jgi:sugar phosphate isomerase/epimerase
MFDRDATGDTRTGSPRAHGEAPEARAGGNQEDPIHGEYLAQFGADSAPFNSWDSITKWAAGHGFKGVQLPSWDTRLIDLERAASSKTYCDEIAGVARANGVEITELGTHLQGQLVAVRPAHDEAFDAFAPDAVKANPKARQKWAVQQMLWSAKASKHLGLKSNVSFPGALA